MEIKKSEKADLEKSKKTFFQLGLVVAIAMLLIAFEWATVERQENIFAAASQDILEEELIPITEPEEIQPETPPEVNVTEIFEIVDNEVQIDNEVVFFDDRMTFDQDIAMVNYEVVLEKEEEEDEIFFIVEDQPQFRGGDISRFSEWVQQRVRYPQLAQENAIQGRVVIGFVVEPNGTLSNIEVMRGVDTLLDEEAVRVVSSSPTWTPGKQRGIPVRVRFTIHVNFQLQ